MKSSKKIMIILGIFACLFMTSCQIFPQQRIQDIHETKKERTLTEDEKREEELWTKWLEKVYGQNYNGVGKKELKTGFNNFFWYLAAFVLVFGIVNFIFEWHPKSVTWFCAIFLLLFIA